MPWKTITPSMGGRRSHAVVSLACRRSSSVAKVGYYNFVYTISQELRAQLGWGEKIFVLIQLGTAEDAGTVRITPITSETDGWRLTLNKTALQGVVPLEAPADRVIGATVIPHAIDNGSLVLTLPVWGGGKLEMPATEPRAPRGRAAKPVPPPKPAPVVAAAPRPAPAVSVTPRPPTFQALAAAFQAGAKPPPKPVVLTPDQQDEAEAIEMLRAGKSNRELMEYFGWPFDRVAGLRRQVVACAAEPKFTRNGTLEGARV